MTFAFAFNALCVMWAGSEIWLTRRKRAAVSEARDAGTLRLLWLVLGTAIFFGIFFAYSGLARFPPAWRTQAMWAGLALMAIGLALRWWAIRILARQFTVNVAIRADHQLVREGPYALLRHPSYTGALLTFFGCGLACGNWLSLTLISVPTVFAFLHRIRVEEAVLSQAFPHEYADYARKTRRLIPFVW